jgi:hypothetical protein
VAKRIEGPYDFSKHSFQKYADGATWELTEGEDFSIQPSSIAAAARAWARQEDLSVEVRVMEGEPAVVAVRFTRPPRLHAVEQTRMDSVT